MCVLPIAVGGCEDDEEDGEEERDGGEEDGEEGEEGEGVEVSPELVPPEGVWKETVLVVEVIILTGTVVRDDVSRDDNDNDAITKVVLVSTKSLLAIISCIKLEDTAEPKNEKKGIIHQAHLSLTIPLCIKGREWQY